MSCNMCPYSTVLARGASTPLDATGTDKSRLKLPLSGHYSLLGIILAHDVMLYFTHALLTVTMHSHVPVRSYIHEQW